jgi:hypothetical protein
MLAYLCQAVYLSSAKTVSIMKAKVLSRIQIDFILDRYHIQLEEKNYKINIDGSIDTKGSVKISGNKLARLPLRFGKVGGDFICCNNSLKSLVGSPSYVGGNFKCNDNQLTSLKYGPKHVGGSYFCQENDLRTLSGAPTKIPGRFNCVLNKLNSLRYGPEWVGKSYYAHHNSLTTLEGSPAYVGGTFQIAANFFLNDLCGCPDYIGGGFYLDKSIPSLYMADKNCIVNFVRFEALENIHKDRQSLPQSILTNKKQMPIIFKYNRYLDIWSKDGTINYENLNDMLLEIYEGLL